MSVAAQSGSTIESAVPTLKVMRMQKPDLHMPTAGTLQTNCLLGMAMSLPDSFGVIHVGETFTAYLGALNVSRTLPVARLTVTAQLQTPSQRWHLASAMDVGNAAGGVDVPPESGVDAIVSHALEEAGQHILRVEVGYAGSDGGIKTLRKFYRFQVSNPLTITHLTYRASDSCCFVSALLENSAAETRGGLAICEAEFNPSDGLTAELVGNQAGINSPVSGVELFDRGGRLEAGEAVRYLFRVVASGKTSMRGIAAGDDLGIATFTWRKACGEMGRLASGPITAPSLSVVLDTFRPANSEEIAESYPKSALSVDVASAAALNLADADRNGLLTSFPVTVEPVDPPNQMKLGVPASMNFLVINHSDQEMSLQFKFSSEAMEGLVVCGSSFKNLESLPAKGGSTVVTMRFIPLKSGLLGIRGCSIEDLNHSQSFPQPLLGHVIVET